MLNNATIFPTISKIETNPSIVDTIINLVSKGKKLSVTIYLFDALNICRFLKLV